ncbi:MAG: V-type ATP synthase subunit D [Candidatus Thermoplasmatota archaeon]|jgi:V/A-type H+-transporting ATPase subunit D|nr:V-type ATP synthase subunit D [Candidatus Thermoplasmatota archaeon]MCL5800298.1 V-type ATP synthase subunit D [Candidatus Thermoplasmatota archaeon]
MPSADVRPTRIELINTNRRIKFAQRGLDLLKMKRSSLVMEFFKISRTVRGMRSDLRIKLQDSIESLKTADVIDGSVVVEAIANMYAETRAAVTTKNVMGVRIPTVEIDPGTSVISEIYRATSVPVAINEAISRFEELMKLILEVAEKESSLRRLLREIEKTKRRSNAIENILIPRLKGNSKYIRMRLDEIERDTFTTLKTVKRNIERRGEIESNEVPQ